jgi:hypothetical protein
LTIDATDLLVGYVLVDPTGISSYQQATQNQIDNGKSIVAVPALQL